MMIKAKPVDALKKTSTALGIYASLVGMEHGIFQILRSDLKPSGLLIYAIGPACDPELVWHGCFPALTVLPSYPASGIAAILISLYLLVWVTELSDTPHAARMITLFSILLLPFGGGFVPVYIGLLASLSFALHASGQRLRINSPSNITMLFSRLWRPALIVFLVWFPLSWVFGYFFNSLMLSSGPLFFILFDILLPIMILFAALQSEKQEAVREYPA